MVASLAPFTLASAGTPLALGARFAQAVALFLALGIFACRRSILVARALRETAAWDRTMLCSRGLREAAQGALWEIDVAVLF